jgi:acyl-CoA reductase-like NAD-dependent aldehyde dehydrogenase
MVIGDPTRADTQVGPLIRPEAGERVALWVEEAIAQGVRRLSGATRLSPTAYACTVLLALPPQARVSTQEIFGPVICVYAYEDLDEALGRANALPFAFQAAVFTRDIDTALYCYRRLGASAVMVNDHTAFRVDWMPFAGLKRSGPGVGGIPYSFREMQVEKLMVLRSGAL